MEVHCGLACLVGLAAAWRAKRPAQEDVGLATAEAQS
jgi:hypothetical protein